MAGKIAVSLTDEEKALLKVHPDYRHGNKEIFCSSIVRQFLNSPQYKLDIANQKCERQEREIKSLKARGDWRESRLAEKTKESATWRMKAILAGWRPTPLSAPREAQGSCPTMAAPDARTNPADANETTA